MPLNSLLLAIVTRLMQWYSVCVSGAGFAQFTATHHREHIWFWYSRWSFMWLVYWAPGLHQPIRVWYSLSSAWTTRIPTASCLQVSGRFKLSIRVSYIMFTGMYVVCVCGIFFCIWYWSACVILFSDCSFIWLNIS